MWRPEDPARFDGTVVVEWLNVSARRGRRSRLDLLHRACIREGMAWVGVSAQQVGVQGGTTILRTPSARGPHHARSGALRARCVHPGDSFSYDIFTQAGLALRPALTAPARPAAGTRPLGDLVVERLIAIGESQSAFRLTTYINAVDPIARVYDAYLVHAARRRQRGALGDSTTGAAGAHADVVPERPPRPGALRRVRDRPAHARLSAARQPDSERFRLWEMAGTAHADVYTIRVGAIDDGRRSPDGAGGGLGCLPPPPLRG